MGHGGFDGEVQNHEYIFVLGPIVNAHRPFVRHVGHVHRLLFGKRDGWQLAAKPKRFAIEFAETRCFSFLAPVHNSICFAENVARRVLRVGDFPRLMERGEFLAPPGAATASARAGRCDW